MKAKTAKSFFVDSFPPPVFMQMFAAGLDISDRRVRFLEFKRSKNGIVIKRFGESKIAPGVIVSGKIKRPEELNKILSTFAKEYNLEFVRVSLPEERAYLVKMEAPDVSHDELRNAIAFQLEEYVPIPAGEAVFDYRVIGESKGHNGYIDVAVSVMPQKDVEEYANLFKGTGLTPVSFEIEAQAIARSVIPDKNTDTVMIVDFGRTRTGIAVVSGGAVRFTSTIDIGSNMVTTAIEKHFSVDNKEAEKIKNEQGLTKKKEDEEFSLAVMSTVAILRDEINKLYIYWHTHHDGADGSSNIKKIILSGGGANLKGLTDYLSSSLRISVEVANPWRNVNSFDNFIPSIPFNSALGYSSVIGLALRSVDVN